MSMIDSDVERLNHKIFIRFGARLVVSDAAHRSGGIESRILHTRAEETTVARWKYACMAVLGARVCAHARFVDAEY